MNSKQTQYAQHLGTEKKPYTTAGGHTSRILERLSIFDQINWSLGSSVMLNQKQLITSS